MFNCGYCSDGFDSEQERDMHRQLSCPNYWDDLNEMRLNAEDMENEHTL